MALTGKQARALHKALMAAFPSRTDLARLARFGLDFNLDELAPPGGNQDVVLELIRWAEAHSAVELLVSAARAENSENTLLRDFAASYLSPPPATAGAARVLLAYTAEDAPLAAPLAAVIAGAGYPVAYQGAVVAEGDEGEPVAEPDAAAVLRDGGPVVLCAGVTALGTGWADDVLGLARRDVRARVIAVQLEPKAKLTRLNPDALVDNYAQDPAAAGREVVAALQRHYPLQAAADPAARGYSAEARYRQLALEACDIVDLANLPESDRHLATRRLDLRRLYVALRVRVEAPLETDLDVAGLEKWEERRLMERRRAALWDRSGQEAPAPPAATVPVGERLGVARRLVVLGDPGAGKTTLLRWIATAYLLRLKRDPDWQEMPDVQTLPDAEWLPVIVRCRDLDATCLGGSLDDVLHHTLRKAELDPAEADALRGLLLTKLRTGQALLLLDGLDEITDPGARARFCRQLEQISLAYPDAPIIATSRIVGYREMGTRIGRGFEHLVVADLSPADKDDFVRRWCAVVERPERREEATRELIHDIHSGDRIERLTGNPMLLTTLALVKRKVGKLPSRRADLYAEAVDVLLRWRGEVDAPLDAYEAIPQLEYLAYAMCDRGVQQLRADEILELLKGMRAEYPQIHAIHAHAPAAFLRLLESRTGLLVEVGRVRHKGREAAVFEFRHLTFQEYLAGLALVDGRFPGRDRARSLAENVAPLAGRLGKVKTKINQTELAVTENWREALRLCVASCADDDVASVLRAILTPLPNEDLTAIARPRAVLAALCLADEPNVSDATAQSVLEALVAQIGPGDGQGPMAGTALDAAAVELGSSRWSGLLKMLLLDAFSKERDEQRIVMGNIFYQSENLIIPTQENDLIEWIKTRTSNIVSDNEHIAIGAALEVMELALQERVYLVPGLVKGLLRMLTISIPTAFAAAWTLYWLSGSHLANSNSVWHPTDDELAHIRVFLETPSLEVNILCSLIPILSYARDINTVEVMSAYLTNGHFSVRGAASKVLGEIGDRRAVEGLLARLADADANVRGAAARSLGEIGDRRAVEGLLAHLADADAYVRTETARALGQIGDGRAVEGLLARLADADADVRMVAAGALGEIGDGRAVAGLLACLADADADVRMVAAGALGEIGDGRAVEGLLARLGDADAGVREAALRGLARTCPDPVDRKLLSQHLYGFGSYLDPQAVIDEARVQSAAASLQLPAEEIRGRYAALAARFGLRLAWAPGGAEAGGGDGVTELDTDERG